MAYRRCPSCGHDYNGKRCKNCLYEPFGDIRPSFELHQKDIRPRQEAPPVRRPAASSRPGYPKKSRKQPDTARTILKRLGTIWSVILLLTGFLPMLFEAVSDVGSSFVEVNVTRETEPLPLPAQGIVLYEDADVLVMADWDGNTPIDGDIGIFVQNFTGEDLIVCTDGVAVNGCMTGDVFFYCNAYPNSVNRATLWVDMEILGEMGIKEGQYLQMTIDVMDEDYNMIVDNAPAVMGSEYIQELSVSGNILFDQDGFQLIYKGMKQDQFGDPLLVFYGQNDTEQFLELSANELLINAEGTGCWLWQNFLPGTRGIFYGHIHDFTIPDAGALAEVELFLTPYGDWNVAGEIGVLNFLLN